MQKWHAIFPFLVSPIYLSDFMELNSKINAAVSCASRTAVGVENAFPQSKEQWHGCGNRSLIDQREDAGCLALCSKPNKSYRAQVSVNGTR